MGLKKAVKKGIKWLYVGYGTAYALVSGHIGYDYLMYNKPRIERGETVQHLEVHRYKVAINGKEKEVTIAGEYHSYNKTEYEIGKKLVEEHEHFASECGSDFFATMSTGDLIYMSMLAIPSIVPFFYNDVGSGRGYPSISDIAEQRGYYVDALEGELNLFKDMPISGKTELVMMVASDLVTAPLMYYRGKNETTYDPKKVEYMAKIMLVDKRDKVMAHGIVDLLKEDDIDKLLVNIGRGHLEGVTYNLSQQLVLREIRE